MKFLGGIFSPLRVVTQDAAVKKVTYLFDQSENKSRPLKLHIRHDQLYVYSSNQLVALMPSTAHCDPKNDI